MRNRYIDYIRGLATVSVIFIHTVWWSGISYVPDYIRQTSLLFDVPVFFFIAGWSSYYCQDIFKGLKNILKTQIRYMVFVLLISTCLIVVGRQISFYQILIWISHINYKDSSPLPVVMGSMWFMRVFLAVNLIALLTIFFHKEKFIFIVSFLIALLFSILGPNADDPFGVFDWIYIPFYMVFYLSGYMINDKVLTKKNELIMLTIAISALVAIQLSNLFKVDVFEIARYKFAPNLVYLLWSAPSILLIVKFKSTTKALLFEDILNNIGRKAIYYYFAQGVSASILYFIIPVYIRWSWPVSLLISFAINTAICIVIAELFVKVEKLILWIFTSRFENITRIKPTINNN